jgi:hypothetical protein
VVKYAKNGEGIPPLAPPQSSPARRVGARSRRTAGRRLSTRDLAAHTVT